MVVLFAISYYQEKNRGWLYAAFFTSGLAASSKYIAGIIVLTALSAMIMVGGRRLIKSRLLTFEMLFTGSGLSILGYVIGTPTAILWLAFYLKRLIPALLRQTQYARTPTSVIGLKGEWNQLEQALGTHIFWLLILSVMFFIIIVMMRKKTQRFATTADHGVLTLLGISLLALDLPIIISYNVQVRYFLPMIPIFAVLIAAAVDAILVPLHQKQNKSVSILLISVLIAFISYSYLISIGVVLAIKNDSRIPAGAFLSRLPKGRTLEYTLYSPNFHEENFSRIHDYPLRFRKFPDEQLPEDSRFVYNEGESGIEERKTDYLVISSFIYNRFNDPYTCGIHAEDCAFFEKLLNGQSNYRNIANFSYQLPWYIPKTRLVFVNPEIRVYERVPLR
jgi:hypothetical protein